MSFVYFIQDEPLIKIGASDSPAHRLMQLRRRHPRARLLVAVEYVRHVVSGRSRAIRYHEHRWHDRYAHARLFGEWFLPVPALLDELDLLIANSQPFIAPGCVSRVVSLPEAA